MTEELIKKLIRTVEEADGNEDHDFSIRLSLGLPVETDYRAKNFKSAFNDYEDTDGYSVQKDKMGIFMEMMRLMKTTDDKITTYTFIPWEINPQWKDKMENLFTEIVESKLTLAQAKELHQEAHTQEHRIKAFKKWETIFTQQTSTLVEPKYFHGFYVDASFAIPLLSQKNELVNKLEAEWDTAVKDKLNEVGDDWEELMILLQYSRNESDTQRIVAQKAIEASRNPKEAAEVIINLDCYSRNYPYAVVLTAQKFYGLTEADKMLIQ